jgi:hypothetical protein
MYFITSRRSLGADIAPVTIEPPTPEVEEIGAGNRHHGRLARIRSNSAA